MTQTTLGGESAYTGPAVHTGTTNTIKLSPAPAHTGIVFRRVDLPGAPTVPATAAAVVSTDRCTTIGAGPAEVSTVEHLMAAFCGLSVDNVFVDIDGPEVPIADGSAQTFAELIAEAGVVPLEAPRRVVTLTDPVWAAADGATLIALPSDTLKISFTFTNDHNHPAMRDFFAEFDLGQHDFAQYIAPARTIGWLTELEALQERGLALGATMDMAIVLSETEILTPLRFPDEPVRHKVLDLIGDLYLAGPVQAHVVAIRSGHRLNNQLARGIMAADPSRKTRVSHEKTGG